MRTPARPGALGFAEKMGPWVMIGSNRVWVKNRFTPKWLALVNKKQPLKPAVRFLVVSFDPQPNGCCTYCPVQAARFVLASVKWGLVDFLTVNGQPRSDP